MSRTSRGVLGCVVTAAIAACGGSPDVKAPVKEVGSAVEREREVASPRSCIGKQRILEALGSKEPTAPAGRREKYRTDPAASLSPSESYRVGAPATVIIRTREGLGSGVIVDASGLVLTNHHVVDDFLQPDLTMKVSLELAETGATGRVQRSGKSFEGVVVKADAVKDLALIRIVQPPKDLPVVKLAGTDPQIGENVLSIGHAGIGLVWAAKACNVSSIGDQTRDTSMLEVGDCKLHDPSDSEKEARRRTEQCEARKRQIREELATATQGLAVQTSCNITHGDSGGPLLNARGELIGLNQSLRFDAATVAFHVHVAEIRAFLQNVPTGAVQVLPDPWCEGGTEATVEDLDGDGRPETVKLVGSSIGHRFGMNEVEATFIDLDGDDGKKNRSKDHPFDAEVIVLKKGDDVFVWYDTDNDGEPDVLLRDKEADGSVETGWRLAKGGRFEQDPSLAGRKTIDVAFLKDEKQRAPLGALAQSLGWTKLASEATLAVAESLAVPDPFTGAVQNANAQTYDGPNEKPILVHAMGPTGDRLFIDTRSEALAALKSGDDARALVEQKKLSPDLVSMTRPNGRWVLYDTDGDGKLDLALFAKNPSDKDDYFGRAGSFVTNAFDVHGAPKRVDGHVGRSVMRPKLLASEQARKVAQMLGGGTDDGRASFPKPYAGGFRSPWVLSEFAGSKRRVLERIDEQSAVAMIDMDGDTKDLATKGADDFVRQQSFDFEVAFLRVGRLAWAYYDTDGDGAYDLVLFTRDAKKATVDAAFALNRAGDVVTTLPPMAGTIVQPERVTKVPRSAEAIRGLFARVNEQKEKPKQPLDTRN